MRVRGGGAYGKQKALKEVDKEGEDVAPLRLNVLLT